MVSNTFEEWAFSFPYIETPTQTFGQVDYPWCLTEWVRINSVLLIKNEQISQCQHENVPGFLVSTELEMSK